MTQTVETTQIHFVIPLDHLGRIVTDYLYHVKAIDDNLGKVTSINIPVTIDDENNVTITVGVVEQAVN